jgi:hypothetical protein
MVILPVFACSLRSFLGDWPRMLVPGRRGVKSTVLLCIVAESTRDDAKANGIVSREEPVKHRPWMRSEGLPTKEKDEAKTLGMSNPPSVSALFRDLPARALYARFRPPKAAYKIIP